MLTGDETDLLKEVEKQKPINEGSKSQLSRANQAMKEKLRAEQEEQEAEELGSEDDVAPGASDEDEPNEGTGGLKRRGEDLKRNTKKAKVTKPGKDKSGKTATKEPSEPSEAKPQEQKWKLFVPAGFDSSVSRAVNRKRFTSRAWHKAHFAAKKDGLSVADCQKAGRDALAAASKQFECLWPVEGATVPDVD